MLGSCNNLHPGEVYLLYLGECVHIKTKSLNRLLEFSLHPPAINSGRASQIVWVPPRMHWDQPRVFVPGVSFVGTWEIGTYSTVVREFGTVKSLAGVGDLGVSASLEDVWKICTE